MNNSTHLWLEEVKNDEMLWKKWEEEEEEADKRTKERKKEVEELTRILIYKEVHHTQKSNEINAASVAYSEYTGGCVITASMFFQQLLY